MLKNYQLDLHVVSIVTKTGEADLLLFSLTMVHRNFYMCALFGIFICTSVSTSTDASTCSDASLHVAFVRIFIIADMAVRSMLYM